MFYHGSLSVLRKSPESERLDMANPDSPVRAGFVGVGNFISGNHLPNLAQSDLWQVYAICDINEDNLNRAKDQYGPPVVTRDYHDLLNDPEVEVVIVGTRHDMHEKLVLETARAGKDVFVEKPMSKTWDESRRMVEAVQQADTRLMVGYNRRFAPSLLRARDIFHARNCGKPAMITYRAVDDARLWPDWPFDPKIGGGKILSEACHFNDLLCWFVKDEPVRIQCIGRREDDNFILITFANGSVGCITSGGCGSASCPKERMEVFADSSSLVVDNFLEVLVDGYEDVEDERFQTKFDPHPEIGDDNTVAGYRAKVRRWRRAGIRDEEFERKAYYGSMPVVEKGHFAAMEAYARAIRAGEPSPTDEIDGARATAMCLKAVESLEAGGAPQAIRGEEYFLSRKR